MFIICFIISGLAISLAQRKCDNLGILLYEDMACKPSVTDTSTGCPTEFNCPNLTKTNGSCFYKNKTYRSGDIVRHPDKFCDVGCICTRDGKFTCAIIECAEYFGLPTSEGCYRIYDLNSCCSKGENCENDNFQCEFEGTTYKEGERFFPKHSCSMCICQKGFKGKIDAPFCVPRRCNVELKRYNKSPEKCAPFYGRDQDLKNGILCCPDKWICPNGNEPILGSASSERQCFFGNMTIKIGQKIKKDTGSQVLGDAICECRIPPLLTCLPEHIPFNG